MLEMLRVGFGHARGCEEMNPQIVAVESQLSLQMVAHHLAQIGAIDPTIPLPIAQGEHAATGEIVLVGGVHSSRAAPGDRCCS